MATSTVFTESWLVGPKSTQFYTRTYLPATTPKAAIVFLHGFAEHVGRYSHFHPLLHDHGIAVFTLDQRGFGKTALEEEHKSKDSAYGKTSWTEQMEDIDWAIKHAKQTFAVPTFLMGHSMGGAEALGFASQGEKSTHYPTITSLSGVIATSPLIHQAKPAPKLLRWAGGKASAFVPHKLIPAHVEPGALSHDPTVGEAYLKDPLVKTMGSLRGLHDMLSQGEALLETRHKAWPANLPVLLIHGTEDKVTSHKATQAFHDKIAAAQKKIVLFEGCFHELQNETDDVPEKLLAEVVAFIEAHLPGERPPAGDERAKM
ncbi:putative monoglyceride lipase [Hypsizygus marmoreus]|uniref:Monoglyceride lipase n=1 Tax=Hypsizygus marmoreus TaxID=39966 RepID=A0A369JUU4_HYPMA|nr:putative monoglyceride lipase [Hypsizygus marmoreus]